jgi:ABC-type nitrate/sulfonate/bicarbonate transport system substrate-binding protein
MSVFSGFCGAFVGVGLMAVASAASSQPAQEITIGLSSATLTTAPLRIAKEMGMFAKQGLDPKFVIMESGNASASALISGAIKIALAGPGELVVAQARGQNVVAIANTYRGLGATLVLSKATADKLGVSPSAPAAERLKALEGLLIGSTSATATYTVALRGAAKSVGANVRFAFMGPIAMGPALETGAIEGFFTSAPYWAPPVVKGQGVIWLSGPKGEVPDEFAPANSVSIMVMRDYAEANPGLMKKLKAVIDEFTKTVDERAADVKAVTAKLFPDVDAPTLELLFASESVAWKTRPPSAKDMAREIEFVKSSGAPLPQIDNLSPASLMYP